MKVVLQQLSTGFYVGATEPLVIAEEQARVFGSSLEGIGYCVAAGIDDVQIVPKFSDERFDVRLHPFGHPELQPNMRRFLNHTEQLACLHEEIRKRMARARHTSAELDSLTAEAKERRKQYPFKPRKSESAA